MGGVLKNLLTPSVSFKGEDGIDSYGGIGATAIYKYAANGEGMGGCGGNMISGKCFSPSDTPYGKDGAKSGSGGGVVLSGILFRIKGEWRRWFSIN